MANHDHHRSVDCISQEHFKDCVEIAWAHLFALQPYYSEEEAELFAASCLEFKEFLHQNARFELNDWYIRSLCTKIHHPDLWSSVSNAWTLLWGTPKLGYQLANTNLWKIHQENFACRFMQVTSLSDFFNSLAIKKSKLSSPIFKSPIWHALNIALQHDCATLGKGYSTGLPAGCLGLIIGSCALPAYLQGLLQDDVLDTIAKTNVASPAIENLMPLVVEDEKDVVMEASRIVYTVETNLDKLIRDWHFEIVKQHITDTGALVGGILAFVTRDIDLINLTMDLVLKYVLQSQNIITAKKRSFFDLGAIVLHGALRLKAKDAGEFIQHIDECVSELGLRGTWNFAKGTGTYPSSWLAQSSAVLGLIASDCPYFDDHEDILYYGTSDKHDSFYDGDLDDNDEESAVDNGDFDGFVGHWAEGADDRENATAPDDWAITEPTVDNGDFDGTIGRWADTAKNNLKQVIASGDWEANTAADNGNFEGPIGHWADAFDTHATDANTWEYTPGSDAQDVVEDYSLNYVRDWDEGVAQHELADWTEHTGTWDSAIGSNFDDVDDKVVETASFDENDAAIDWSFAVGLDASDYGSNSFGLTDKHGKHDEKAAESSAFDAPGIDWNFAVDLTPTDYLHRGSKYECKYDKDEIDEIDEAADLTWNGAFNPIDAEHGEVSWATTTTDNWNDEGYHSVGDWNETTYKKDVAWDDHLGEPFMEESTAPGVWSITEATAVLPAWEDDNANQDLAWNNHTNVRDRSWEEEVPQQTETTWNNNVADDEQTTLWQDKPTSWNTHADVAEEDDVAAFEDQHTASWTENDVAAIAALSWNEDSEANQDVKDSSNDELPSWNNTMADTSPAAASISWSESTIQAEDWNYNKDQFGSKLTYHDDAFDTTFNDNEFNAIKYAFWNEVPVSQSVYVRAY